MVGLVPRRLLHTTLWPPTFQVLLQTARCGSNADPILQTQTIPNIPFAQVAQLIGNMYDDIEIYQYDLPPIKISSACMFAMPEGKKELSRLKQSYWSRTWVDKEGMSLKTTGVTLLKLTTIASST